MVLFGCFSIMFIAKWFGRVCLLGTALYKQACLYTNRQTMQVSSNACVGTEHSWAFFWYAMQRWILMGEKTRIRISTGIDQHSLLTSTKDVILGFAVKLMHCTVYVLFLSSSYSCIFCLRVVLSAYLH